MRCGVSHQADKKRSTACYVVNFLSHSIVVLSENSRDMDSGEIRSDATADDQCTAKEEEEVTICAESLESSRPDLESSISSMDIQLSKETASVPKKIIEQWLTSAPVEYALSDELYHEIQTVVDEASTRLEDDDDREHMGGSSTQPFSDERSSSSSSSSSSAAADDVFLIIDVMIGPEETATIEIRQTDVPLDLAKAFVAQNNLHESMISNLVQHIETQMQSAMKPPAPALVMTQEDVEGSSNADDFVALHSHEREEHNCLANLGQKKRVSVFERLYSAARTREARVRAQIATQEQEKEAQIEAESRREVSTPRINPKSRKLAQQRRRQVVNPKHITERLYDMGVAKLLKSGSKDKKKKPREEEQEPWTCAKCAKLNSRHVVTCQRIIAMTNTEMAFQPTNVQLLSENFGRRCSYPRGRDFRPTRISTTRHDPSFVPTTTTTVMVPGHRPSAPYRHRGRPTSAEAWTFHPTVNARSRQLAPTSRHGTTALHSSLYLEAGRRRRSQREREEAHYAQYPFQPEISTSRRTPPSRYPVVERLTTTRAAGTNGAKDDDLELDPETGQRWFHPRVGRAPIVSRNASNLPIGDFLYASRGNMAALRENQQEAREERRVAHMKSATRVSLYSAQLAERRETRRSQALFRDLCDLTSHVKHPDKDKSSLDKPELLLDIAHSLTHESLPADIQSVLRTVMRSRSRSNVLSCEDFVSLVRHEHWTSDLRKTKRLTFEDVRIEEEEEEELTFRPTIDPVSSAMMKDRHGPEIFESLYQDHARNQDQHQRRLARDQEQFEAECPFRPTLVATKEPRRRMWSNMYHKLGYELNVDNDDDDALGVLPLKTVRPHVRPWSTTIQDKVQSSPWTKTPPDHPRPISNKSDKRIKTFGMPEFQHTTLDDILASGAERLTEEDDDAYDEEVHDYLADDEILP